MVPADGPAEVTGAGPTCASGPWFYFAPKPPEGKAGNWLQTVPGKSWWLALRMYGPLKPWINQTWRPSVNELVQ